MAQRRIQKRQRQVLHQLPLDKIEPALEHAGHRSECLASRQLSHGPGNQAVSV